MPAKEDFLQAALDKTADGEKVLGTSFGIKKDNLVWFGSFGNLNKDQTYFIASTTKLSTTAISMDLRSRGKITLEDKISKLLDKSIISGLNFYKGNCTLSHT